MRSTTASHALKRVVILFLATLPAILFAQIKPILTKGTTRAVIIGISDYQNEHITDLRFADVDARAFADFLQSPAGGKVPAQNIQLLTNEKATQGQMAAALTWLSEESNSGDQAIIYFSGHGDMETLTGMSFLLAYNASASAYSGGGSFPIIFLQSIITRLSTQKQVQVLLITDACRAGKLAGSDIGGAQATTKILSDQFSNEVKILSCQPNEFSLEGTEWGGGRGVFSYYLIDGLKGLADNNKDLSVSLMEVGRFLEDKVPAATAPHSQIPMIVGNKGVVVAQVDPPTLANLHTTPAAAITTIASKSGVQGLINTEDSTAERLLRLYEKALVEGRLLQPEQGSAYSLYLQLKDRPSMKSHIGLMRRNLAAQLQDEAQVAINDYLSADPRELRKRWSFDNRYEKFPQYLAKSAEILGSDHFQYQQLKAREHYFAGLNLRLQAERNNRDSLFRVAQVEQKEAIKLDTSATFAYNELGHLALSLNEDQASVQYLRKAISLSPTWVLPWSNLCFSYIKLKDYTQAESCGLKAVALDSTFVMANYNLGLTYQRIEDQKKAAFYFKRTLRYDAEYVKAYFNLGLAEYYLGQYKQAEKTFQEYSKRVPNDPDGYQSLAEIALKLNNLNGAEAQYKKALAVDPNYDGALFSLGELFGTKKKFDVSADYFQQYLQHNPNDAEGLFQLACAQVQMKLPEIALKNLELAFKNGFQDFERLKTSDKLLDIKKAPGYQALIGQYFPGKE